MTCCRPTCNRASELVIVPSLSTEDSRMARMSCTVHAGKLLVDTLRIYADARVCPVPRDRVDVEKGTVRKAARRAKHSVVRRRRSA